MINEDFVSYELAKALKKAGFNWECEYIYPQALPNHEPFLERDAAKYFRLTGKFIYTCKKYLCPTLAQAQKWLREKKGVAVSIQAELTNGELWYSADICSLEFENTLVDGGFPYKTYESALSAGIEAALKLIEEGAR